MRKKQKRHNDVDDTIHGLASALLHIGAIEKPTMRRFDKNALTPVDALTPSNSAHCGNGNTSVRPSWRTI
jgi:DNA-binding transcriptional regulator YiaG